MSMRVIKKVLVSLWPNYIFFIIIIIFFFLGGGGGGRGHGLAVGYQTCSKEVPGLSPALLLWFVSQ